MSAGGEPFATTESVGAQGPYHALRIRRIVDETSGARSRVLEIPDDLKEAFAYRAGQFLTFRVRVDGQRLVRCYSLSSSPAVDDEHKVTIKRIDQGRVSNWINDTLEVGDVLETLRPAGVFCLQDRTTPIVLFGGGSGITPVISLVKTALATTARRVRLLYANRDRDAVIFRDELDALAAAHADRFELAHRLDVEEGFIDASVVRDFVGDQLDADFYVCGPGPFMDVVERTLEELGVPAGHFFIERFVSLSDEGASEGVAVEAIEGDAAPATITVRLDGQEHEVPYSAGQTVLEAVRAAGLEPPFACEEGYCSCCMARVTTGEVRMRTNDALDEDQVEEHWVLTCQSVPRSDVLTIEYPD